MWLMLNDAFFSIVHKDCARDELLIRARRAGDIEKVFGADVPVTRVGVADYLFRTVMKRDAVHRVIGEELKRVVYGNFKNSVEDKPLHDAYMQVWTSMSKLQPTPPYRGDVDQPEADFGFLMPAEHAPAKKPRKKRAPSKLKKGM
jgi:hypothetical protein